VGIGRAGCLIKRFGEVGKSQMSEDILNFEEHRRRRDENASLVRCARCGKMILATATTCAECGVHFQGEAQDFLHPSACPRIGQRKDRKVIYLYYGGTLQARAMALMGRKMEAAQALEGKFSAEGLASMAGEEGSAEMALAKSLADRIEEGEAVRHWAKVGASVVNAMSNVEFDEELPAFDQGTLAILRVAFGQPTLQCTG